LRQHTTPDAQGRVEVLVGDQLSQAQREFLQRDAFRGYDNDSGMTMLRIGSMNMILHGINQPRFFYADTLAGDFSDSAAYDVILMNPPFKGKVNQAEVSETLPDNTTKSELLFLHLILRALDMGGRCAVIVPDGVLFGSSRAHVEIRQKLIEENRLDGVISMPGGVFKPYAGVSTAVLLFTRGATTERIWFYDMAHDGFSLDDKRQPVAENDIPDLITCWQNRHNPDFQTERQARLEQIKAELTPLKTDRLAHLAEINRLTFASVIAPEDGPPTPPSNSPQWGEDVASSPLGGIEGGPTDGQLPLPLDGQTATTIHTELEQAQTELADLEAKIAPLQGQIDQLTRQFWVSKKAVKANKYDLSASRYRQIEQDAAYYEKPQVTMERLLTLERVMREEVEELMKEVKK
jgi:type I restriction enzyme M protein